MGFAQEMPQVGDIVKFSYKSGTYVGEVAETGSPRAVVKVLAVLKHPDQGDLHNPYNPDVPMFHERRALSHTEKALVPLRDIEPYRGGEVPDYRASLLRALESELEALDRLRRWTERASSQLEGLKRDYNL
ncbi:sporulation phosphorelay system protein KapB [Paenibacillus beijingensis]|uniref:Kinase n=1 Tax=Paenibacillus beijingensis TaxID=1126833 RepID=A0A0D5NG83_9BACL|nr:sporulation phosphorelay system protein KapB [Paenibacillus beijingensis]AJY73987.1 kinase [Paenibacillus beijingensis]